MYTFLNVESYKSIVAFINKMRYFVKDSVCIVALSLQVCARIEGSISACINTDLRQSLQQIRVISPAHFFAFCPCLDQCSKVSSHHTCVSYLNRPRYINTTYIYGTLGTYGCGITALLITPRIQHVMPTKPRLATPPNTRLPSDKPWLIISLSHHHRKT